MADLAKLMAESVELLRAGEDPRGMRARYEARAKTLPLPHPLGYVAERVAEARQHYADATDGTRECARDHLFAVLDLYVTIAETLRKSGVL